MIDVHRLRVFRAVIAEGSIGGASEALGYTASAVSQHVSALQRELGLTLVERNGRGIRPTEAGLTLATGSVRVFDELARVEAMVSDLRNHRSGRLSVAYFASAGDAWMPSIVAQIRDEFPDIRLDLRLIELMTADRESAPDIEICVDDDTPVTRAGYHSVPLLTDEYVAVVPSDSGFGACEEVVLRDLVSLPWIDNDVARGICRANLLKACTAAGFAPDFAVEAHDFRTAIRFVAAGVGLTVVPGLAVRDLPDGVHVVRICDPTPVRQIVLRTRNGVRGVPVADRVMELLVAQANAMVGGADAGLR
ncbi:LysR family transcriptional regulator [Gordonia sp. (in: high G+C Gram-positive bacteria)]|jgi:DNA-binding transcriptional LysR family regulator|uniref:LysR family transcriptional regulator n=1 Tax=Gordonia sp. (in: high G+C Gram-positive bacteria) TaxID=84139 RepID=UPI001D83334A|nr:LysR family transcriptional regulator [Gordonia sp. (in: high G+C Gram-positive bacteria)]MCB1295211.1 LysR family transcriptional regulator [Gordonia sp. (in: high G+C Gram-positive bacteria)]HMS73678.1 LysR family transcriptional regulator [Gordonia sp. (in: high G+C Gram-positive bacteria)]HQV16906.1 LysR family transcriptional regulator [Gordonia sp. (in: high G+C Gram-positive bacteria)]